MRELIKRLCQDEGGEDLSEYALVIALILLVAIVAILGGGVNASHAYSNTQVSSTS